ncbi:hypothetical protein R1sor_017165 [Riccia sorocarpa]|uniref:Uncharacterized protein n=1 Tax=Riccia sorocarpa TaxID=122646 RepID=A0ABD3I6F7_9MARC
MAGEGREWPGNDGADREGPQVGAREDRVVQEKMTVLRGSPGTAGKGVRPSHSSGGTGKKVMRSERLGFYVCVSVSESFHGRVRSSLLRGRDGHHESSQKNLRRKEEGTEESCPHPYATLPTYSIRRNDAVDERGIKSSHGCEVPPLAPRRSRVWSGMHSDGGAETAVVTGDNSELAQESEEEADGT